MPYFEDEISTSDPGLTDLETALCLKVPGVGGEEFVVHREVGGESFVFLFESLDDACDYADAAEKALTYAPQISRVRVETLHFRTARFKPAIGDQIDIPIRRR